MLRCYIKLETTCKHSAHLDEKKKDIEWLRPDLLVKVRDSFVGGWLLGICWSMLDLTPSQVSHAHVIASLDLGWIQTDFLNYHRGRKLQGESGHAPAGRFWIFTPWSPLSWVSESFRQDIGQFHSPRMKLCKSADDFIKVNFHVCRGYGARLQLGNFFY